MTRPRSATRLWYTLLSLAILSSLMAACGSATPEAQPTPNGPAPTVTVPFELPVTITLAGQFDDQLLALLDRQIEAFEAANPDILVEVATAPRELDTRREAFAADLAVGDPTRDILLLSPIWLAEFAANGWLLPLNSYLEQQGVDVGNFFPASLQANTLDQQLMALPWTIDGGLLFYRRDLLEKNGYGPPATWADLQRIALDLQEREGLPYGYVWQGAAYEGLTCNTLEFVWAFGGDLWNGEGDLLFDSEETRAALQQMIDLISSGASPAQVTDYQEAATLAAFQQGEAILMRNWSYAWERVNDSGSAVAGRVGLALLPASCLGGSSLALSAHSQNPAQAFRLMAFLVGYEQQAQMALDGVQPPALETVYQDPALLQADPSLPALHAALSRAQPRPQTAAYAHISPIIYTQVHTMLQGEQDSPTTAAEIQRRIEALLPQ